MSKELTAQQEVIASLPEHLRPFVAFQDYEQYTPRDHAAWRFLIHQLKINLSNSAQPTYLEGLKRTGISTEHIPRIEDINQCLNKLGWRAVVVDGFLPPAIFMEFQAIRVLVIAVNMRSFEHMLYTPAPDIVHESAGHAPFLIDIDYAEFLQHFGELGMRALANQADIAVYEAVRNLSIVKETSGATEQEITKAEQMLEQAVAADTDPSEAALLARLHWWTVEYGLVGTVDDYTIYGAGLLSSLGESMLCLDDDKVTKIPLTVNSIDTAYDITAQQPQLYVTESCRHLSQILEEFGRTMACNRGGTSALQQAMQAKTVCTMKTNSGLQISGKLSRIIEDAVGNATYFNTEGPTQLSYHNLELEGQGRQAHAQGFGSPLGRLVGFERCLSSYTVDELKRHHIELGKQAELIYLSGITVKGKLDSITRREQKNILLSFSDCSVTDLDGTVLFDPSWGMFDMAVGDSIAAVKGGSADKKAWPLYQAPSSKTTTSQKYSKNAQEQFPLYAAIRDLRESSNSSMTVTSLAEKVHALSEPDWLLVFECLELAQHQQCEGKIKASLRDCLLKIRENSQADVVSLINYGLSRLD